MEAYFAARGVTPDRITFLQRPVKTWVAKKGKLVALARNEATRSLTLWRQRTKANQDTTDIRAYLRDAEDADPSYVHREVYLVWTTPLASIDAPLREFLEAMAANYPLAQGAAASLPSMDAAAREVLSTIGDRRLVPPAVLERLHEDALSWRQFPHKLRRLYPVTIVGPAIWQALPPMPRFDPMPTVEDLGDCKLLTAWPTLCDPRDPVFLRGTRELRAWLWPYTIQNPADHVDQDPVA